MKSPTLRALAALLIAAYEGEIPGTERWQCGNYLEHDLPEAKRAAADLCKHLEGWTVERLQYTA